MIIDSLVEFADAVATGNTGTRVVGNVVDLENLRDIGNGEPVYLQVSVATAITAGSGGTYQIALTTADNDALSSNPVNVVTTAAIAVGAGIAQGTRLLQVALPLTAYKRYLGIREIVGTANTSTGAIDAFLTLDPNGWRDYPNATGV